MYLRCCINSFRSSADTLPCITPRYFTAPQSTKQHLHLKGNWDAIKALLFFETNPSPPYFILFSHQTWNALSFWKWSVSIWREEINYSCKDKLMFQRARPGIFQNKTCLIQKRWLCRRSGVALKVFFGGEGGQTASLPMPQNLERTASFAKIFAWTLSILNVLAYFPTSAFLDRWAEQIHQQWTPALAHWLTDSSVACNHNIKD